MLTIDINANMFIIPNNAGPITNFMWYKYVGDKEHQYADKHLNEYKKLYDANGKEFNTDEDLIQVWLTGEVSDNILRHGFMYEIDGKEYYFSNMHLSYLENLPKCLIDIKEGETCDVLVKDIPAVNTDTNSTITVNIKFHITANQKAYRYRNFGNYEEVLAKVSSK